MYVDRFANHGQEVAKVSPLITSEPLKNLLLQKYQLDTNSDTNPQSEIQDSQVMSDIFHMHILEKQHYQS
ncbi:hypothetical protein AALP_AA8G137100 [Arabis alpina]|uniref:Uncharacterized protein n=1 Tax=Arabis alpina TaxID=50452 RepID=A0A087G6V9_ARAAL|nr:hypothetical protein AALP_AA8G137100 [Arabis alpina]